MVLLELASMDPTSSPLFLRSTTATTTHNHHHRHRRHHTDTSVLEYFTLSSGTGNSKRSIHSSSINIFDEPEISLEETILIQASSLTNKKEVNSSTMVESSSSAAPFRFLVEDLSDSSLREDEEDQVEMNDNQEPAAPVLKMQRAQSACSLQAYLAMGLRLRNDLLTEGEREEQDQEGNDVASTITTTILHEKNAVILEKENPATPSALQQEEKEKAAPVPRDFLPSVLKAIEKKKWNRVLEYLERDPSLSKREVSLVCQGENSRCLLVHLLSTGPMEAPVSVIEALVTYHPASLLLKDDRGKRLPLHLAVLTGASQSVVHYLCTARPQALKHPDQEGNYPLHYASMYGSEETITLFAKMYSHACRFTNGRDRLPLHLLCARCFDESSLSSGLKVLLDAYPEGSKVEDRFGRTALHLASQVQHPQWSFLEKLIEANPKALLHKDKSRQIPLQLARKNHFFASPNQADILLSALEEATTREQRKVHPLLPIASKIFLSSSRTRSHHHVKNTPSSEKTVDLYHCYG